jgi:hypothetical protein
VELVEVVAAAVEERRPELELLVRDLVDRELHRVAVELVAAELTARRNGTAAVDRTSPKSEANKREATNKREAMSADRETATGEVASADVPASEPPPAVKACRRCSEVKRLTAFPVEARANDGRRNVCRACNARRHRGCPSLPSQT